MALLTFCVLAEGRFRNAHAQALASNDTPRPLPFLDDEYVLGSLDATVTVVEYLSVTCPHCAAFDASVFPTLAQKYIDTGKVRYIVREMPTSPVTLSSAGFILARCEGELGYWNNVRRLLSHQNELIQAPTLALGVSREAEVLRLDPFSVDRCLSNEAAIDQSNVRRQRGIDAGIEATPTFIFSRKADLSPSKGHRQLTLTGEISLVEFASAYRKTLR